MESGGSEHGNEMGVRIQVKVGINQKAGNIGCMYNIRSFTWHQPRAGDALEMLYRQYEAFRSSSKKIVLNLELLHMA